MSNICKIMLAAIVFCCAIFTNVAAQNTIVKCQYWFDNIVDEAIIQQVSTLENLDYIAQINPTTLHDGMHIFNIRFCDDNGVWTSVVSKFFIKNVADYYNTEVNTVTACQYWFDNDFNEAVTQQLSSEENLNFVAQLDPEMLYEGLHILNIRFMDNKGVWSSVISEFFIKNVADYYDAGTVITEFQYWFDNDFDNAQTQATDSHENINFVAQLDANSIVDGLHLLNIRYRDSKGKWSSTVRHFFDKSSSLLMSYNQVVGYQYWLNEDFDNAKYVQLASPIKDIVLDETLDLTDVPKGTYELNVRFEDLSGKWSSVFVDTIEKLSCPVANYIYDVISADCQYMTASFSGYSVDGDVFEWDFGDGTTDAQDLNPIHQFAEGTYNVSLTVSDTTEHKDSTYVMSISFVPEVLYNEINVTACDSYIWNGDTLVISNDYVAELVSVAGCDSIVTMHLTINNTEYSEFSEVADNSFAWNEVIYCESGDYVQTFESVNSCDSVVTLHLTINTGDVRNYMIGNVGLYPNPASESLNIESDDVIEYIDIVSVTGQMISRIEFGDSRAVCDVNNFEDGIYFVKIHFEKEGPIIVRKFIKQ